MKYKFFIFLFGLNLFYANAQKDTVSQLSKQMMFEDFDYLYSVIKEINPQVGIRKIVTGYDILENIQKHRTLIDTITTLPSFLHLISKTLNLCQEQHISMITPPYGYQKNIDSSTIKLNKIYAGMLTSNPAFWEMPILKYHQGNYYCYIPAIISNTNNNRKIRVPIGTQLISINNQSIDNYFNNFVSDISWDVRLNKFYLPLATIPISCNEITLQYKSGKIKKIEGRLFLSVKRNYSLTVNTPYVIYLENKNILFIRIPDMDYGNLEYYKQEIIQQTQKKTVKKVVIDIRSNGGGNDAVWVEILRTIIDSPLKTRYHFIAKENSFVKEYFRNILAYNIDSNAVISLPMLNDETFIEVYKETDTIFPSDNSIHYSGKIYVLQDENTFSAAGSLVRVANEISNRFVTIGEQTGKMCGRGLNPVIVVLPHSKITFRMIAVLDFVNVQTPYDFYHDKVMNLIEITPQQWYDCNITEKRRYSSKFLYDKDPFFQKVLEME
jgi:hypothetical protein